MSITEFFSRFLFHMVVPRGGGGGVGGGRRRDGTGMMGPEKGGHSGANLI